MRRDLHKSRQYKWASAWKMLNGVGAAYQGCMIPGTEETTWRTSCIFRKASTALGKSRQLSDILIKSLMFLRPVMRMVSQIWLPFVFPFRLVMHM